MFLNVKSCVGQVKSQTITKCILPGRAGLKIKFPFIRISGPAQIEDRLDNPVPLEACERILDREEAASLLPYIPRSLKKKRAGLSGKRHTDFIIHVLRKMKKEAGPGAPAEQLAEALEELELIFWMGLIHEKEFTIEIGEKRKKVDGKSISRLMKAVREC